MECSRTDRDVERSVIEQWCYDVYTTALDKSLDEAKDLPIPQKALRARSRFIDALRETKEDLATMIDFGEQQKLLDSKANRQLQSMRQQLSDLELLIERMQNLDPLKPNGELFPGACPRWESLPYAAIAFAQAHLLKEPLRWLTPRSPAAADQLKVSLEELHASAAKADEANQKKTCDTNQASDDRFQKLLKQHPSWKDPFEYHVAKEHYQGEITAIRRAACVALDLPERRIGYFENLLWDKRHKKFKMFFDEFHENSFAKACINRLPNCDELRRRLGSNSNQ